ncbi:MAG TPA: glycine cleavage T C-terminal barrel domain-containing protein, partial [Thermoanaerobaculaceae bacterium]|nr:glycine cleavage T C-terminal barrel domain-containing protein [Thermoanaerobaculaceae bacterium]
YTGEAGYEFYCAAANGIKLYNLLLAAGKDLGAEPAGLGARDTLRFEACMPLYGNDIDDTTTPFDAGLGWIVKLDKGDFLGHEALARQQAEGPKRRLVGFAMTGRGIARHGYPIWRGDKQVGVVTSGSHAPSLNRALGMGYVPVDLAAVGTVIDIEIRGQKVAAEIVGMPFYRRAK